MSTTRRYGVAPTARPDDDATVVLDTNRGIVTRLGYSPTEFAQAIGVHPNSVYKWLRSGQLPHLRLGRRYVITAVTLKALLAGGEL